MEYTTPSQFINEDQRNVNVWAGSYSSFGNSYMVAGCFVGPRNRVTVKVFYEWLHIIIESDENPTPFRLFLLEDEFTPALHPNTPNRRLGANIRSLLQDISISDCLDPNTEAILEEGQYMLFEVTGRNQLTYFLPELRTVGAYSRHRSGGHTPTGATHRNNRVRQGVRMRDGICRITGQASLPRNRGINFEGLEVAHVYPMGWDDRVESMCGHDAAALNFFDNPQNIDSPQNALLLSADVHAYFDDYQFGVSNNRIHVFEESGAPSFPNASGNSGLRLSRPSTDILHPHAALGLVPGVSTVALDHHFSIGLLWHVAGFGRGRKASALGGIIPQH